MGPCTAASSCCCGASSCAFFTSEPGPVSVVMAAAHPALLPSPTRRDKRCHLSAWGWRTPAGPPAAQDDPATSAGACPSLPCCLHVQLCCQSPSSPSMLEGGFAKGWWQQHRMPRISGARGKEPAVWGKGKWQGPTMVKAWGSHSIPALTAGSEAGQGPALGLWYLHQYLL